MTIIPRGMALGVTVYLPDDRHNYTRDYLETRLATAYGGRVAEEIFLNQMSTGAGSDIEVATDLARRMVCEYGMSRLGPLTFGKKEEQIFLGREIAQHRDFSEETARQIDLEVRRLIDEAYQSAYSIIERTQGCDAPACGGAAGARDHRRRRGKAADRGQGTAADAVHTGGAERRSRKRAAGAQAGAAEWVGVPGGIA